MLYNVSLTEQKQNFLSYHVLTRLLFLLQKEQIRQFRYSWVFNENKYDAMILRNCRQLNYEKNTLINSQ